MLAVFHGVYGNRRVQLPVGAAVNQVDVIAFAHLLPLLFSAVEIGFGQSGVGQYFLGQVEFLGNDIAQCHDFDTVDVGETNHGATSSGTNPDKGNPNRVDGFTAQAQYVGLAGGPFRGREFDHLALRSRRFMTAGHEQAHGEERTKSEE